MKQAWFVAVLLAGCAGGMDVDAGAGRCVEGVRAPPCLLPNAVPVCGDAYRVQCDRGIAWATAGCPERVDGGWACPGGEAPHCVSPGSCERMQTLCGAGYRPCL